MEQTSFHLSFVQSSTPITDPVSKLGGQPCWLQEPAWPVSRKTGKPMTFLAQLRLEGAPFGNPSPARMAYIFMTGAGFDEDAPETWDPELGESAVIIQPGVYAKPSTPSSQGPAAEHLHYDTPGVDRKRPAEFLIKTRLTSEHPFVAQDEVDAMDPTEQERISRSWRGVKSGGSPYWIQGEEFPFDPWFLVFQAEDDDLPIAVNFGTGIGYCFANAQLTEAKLLWQC